MKILYHHRIASQDGQQVHIEEIVRALQSQGHTVNLVGPSFHKNAEFGHDGGFVSSLKKKLPKWTYELLELGYSAVVAARLIKHIIKDKPDFIYERYNLYQPLGVIISRLMKIPVLLEVNAPLVLERNRFAGGIALPKLAKWVENITWRYADAALPVSKVLSEHLVNAGVAPSKIHVIHNGIRESLLEENKSKSTDLSSSDSVIVGFVGFMHLTCGLEWVMEAIAESGNKKVKLVCVGDGNILPALKEKSRSLQIEDQVTFTGLVNRDDVMGHIRNFDIAIQPDVTEYASPLKMFEYMAHKCLVVAPDSNNIKEILDSDCAVFFKHGDKNDLKRILSETLCSLHLAGNKRDNVYQKVYSSGFTWDENARRIVRIAQDALNRTHR